jgi:hypothetical protein
MRWMTSLTDLFLEIPWRIKVRVRDFDIKSLCQLN